MENHSQGTQSAWNSDGLLLERDTLGGGINCDVCVVGAGIAGICCAYWLSRSGRSVVVLDDGPIGGGESGRTTAHLSNAVDDRYFEIARMHGDRAARACAESHTAGIAALEQIALGEGIECDFERVDGYLFLPPGESEDVIYRELAAAHQAGLADVERVLRVPCFESGPALRFPNQAQFHPLKFLAGAARAVEALGGQIHTQTHVDRIGSAGDTLTVRTARGTVVAQDVIVATNSPFYDLVTIHTKQAAYRTYVIAARVQKGAIAKALYWDTSDTPGNLDAPYHFVRLSPDPLEPGSASELVMIGGEDHHTGDAGADAPPRWQRLEDWARPRFPGMREIVHKWSGQVMEPTDGMAFIGHNPTGSQHVYVVTGDSGMGMTHGSIAGLLISDLIMGRTNPWAEYYDPSRKPMHSLLSYARENLRTGTRYGDWIQAGGSEVSLESGCGTVMRRGAKLVAVSRNEQGELLELSAVCPHLGGIVRWNQAEKSWDCPCHGSRFDREGRVLNGPASGDMKRIYPISMAVSR